MAARWIRTPHRAGRGKSRANRYAKSSRGGVSRGDGSGAGGATSATSYASVPLSGVPILGFTVGGFTEDTPITVPSIPSRTVREPPKTKTDIGQWKSRIDPDKLIEMHESGLSLREIGDHFGVTRERVRQVAKQMGLKPRIIALKERNRKVLAAARKSSDSEVANKLGISKNIVALVRRKNGMSWQDMRKERFKPAIQAVADGASIRQAASQFNMSPMTLSKYCDAAGVTTKHGRWGALQHRSTIVPDLLARGASWEEILETLSRLEKREVHLQTLKAWLTTNMPNLNRSVAQRVRHLRRMEVTTERLHEVHA